MKNYCIRIIILILFFLLTHKIAAQRSIIFETVQLRKGDTCTLYNYKNGAPALLQTAFVEEAGEIVLTDTTKITTEGIYMLKLPRAVSRGAIQLIYSKEEKNIKAQYFEHNQNIVFKNSEQNTAFEAYLQTARNFYKLQYDQEKNFLNTTDSIERKKIRDKVLSEQQNLYDYGRRISEGYSGSVVARLISCLNAKPIPDIAWSGELLTYTVESEKYQNAVSFIKQNYWEGVNFTDELLVNTPYLIGKTNYFMSLFNQKDTLNIIKSTTNLLERAVAKAKVYHIIEDALLNLYLQKNSYFFNEEMCIYILKNEPKQIFTPDWRKDVISSRVSFILKNKVGTAAASLNLEDQNGKEISLLRSKSKYTILYFFDPNCSRCAVVSPIVRDWFINVAPKNISFFAVYIDNNSVEWRKYLNENKFPNNWVNLWGNKDFATIRTQYWIESIPSIYLLDENKKVILKDVSYKQLIDYFSKT